MAYQSKSYNFILRLISAVVLIPLVLFIIQLSGYYFTAMVVLAAVIMGGEWFQLSQNQTNAFKVAGILYISAACMSLLWIIDQHHVANNTIKFNGINTVISIFLFVWANDVGGYIFGRILGGKKLCPKISPNKTWSGFFGGILCAILVSPLVAEGVGSAGIAAMVATAGDLLESWAKRKAKVKDSGSFIPGHGGLLDRADGVLSVSIFVGILAVYAKYFA